MKFGLIARADDRGLGIQTLEVARHLRPERVLVVSMPPDQQRHVREDVDRYIALDVPVTVVPPSSLGDRSLMGSWLRGLDVVYSAETFYDWAFCDIARECGVRTVLHANPEFWPFERHPELPRPDVVWLPTTWLRGKLSVETRVVPMPCPIDRWPEPVRNDDPGTLRVLHINGHDAMADRNGTRILLRALRRVTQPMHVSVTTQTKRLPHPRVPSHVSYEAVLGNVANYWDLYRGFDVLVLPRRYGGLCLPAIEAQGAGLAVVMSDAEPNRRSWHQAIVVPGEEATTALPTTLGPIWPFDTNPRSLATTLDKLALAPTWRRRVQEASRSWAEQHSWEQLAPLWEDELRLAVGS